MVFEGLGEDDGDSNMDDEDMASVDDDAASA
jgi:translation initiation factor eIF-2B subunit gamma